MKYLLCVAWLFCASAAHAVVSIESSIRACDNSSAVTSTSSPVNVGASNDLLVVFVGAFDTTYANTVANTVTYNSVGMTLLQNQDDPVTTRRMSIWYMFNPPTGANTLTVTWAGAALGGHVHAVVLTGSLTAGFVDASSGTTNASVTSFSISTATTNNGAITLSFCSSSANALTRQGSAQVQVQRASNNFWWSSFSNVATSGPKTHVYSNGTTDSAVMEIISVDSASSPPFVYNKAMQLERRD